MRIQRSLVRLSRRVKIICCWSNLPVRSAPIRATQQTETLTQGCCHAGSLAATGSNIHQKNISEIDKVHEAVAEMILQFSRDSDQVAAQTTSLYETMAQPLAELPCPSRDGQAETIGDHLTLLQEEFANADDRIQALREKWLACFATEQEAWQRLTSDETGEPRAELELQNLVTAVDELTAKAEAEMKKIEEASPWTRARHATTCHGQNR